MKTKSQELIKMLAGKLVNWLNVFSKSYFNWLTQFILINLCGGNVLSELLETVELLKKLLSYVS